MHRDMIFSYTRDLLEQLTGGCTEADQDGDFPIELRHQEPRIKSKELI